MYISIGLFIMNWIYISESYNNRINICFKDELCVGLFWQIIETQISKSLLGILQTISDLLPENEHKVASLYTEI